MSKLSKELERAIAREEKDRPELPLASVKLIGDALLEFDYEYFGLRRESYRPEDGSVLPESMNHETDEWLDGTSTLAVRATEASIARALERSKAYMGDWLVLVGSNVDRGGEDPGESLLFEPVVLLIMRPPAWEPGRRKG
jgi:hypothetical protein